MKGAAGVEPATSRSAVECSTTELYSRRRNVVLANLFLTLLCVLIVCSQSMHSAHKQLYVDYVPCP